jgi:hypothetical protein
MDRFPYRSTLIVIALLFFALPTASAQPQQPVDPWQYPSLVKSKPFQRWWWAFQMRAYPLGDIPADAKVARSIRSSS